MLLYAIVEGLCSHCTLILRTDLLGIALSMLVIHLLYIANGPVTDTDAHARAHAHTHHARTHIPATHHFVVIPPNASHLAQQLRTGTKQGRSGERLSLQNQRRNVNRLLSVISSLHTQCFHAYRYVRMCVCMLVMY